MLGLFAVGLGIARIIAGDPAERLVAERVLASVFDVLDIAPPAASAWVVALACLGVCLWRRPNFRQLPRQAGASLIIGLLLCVPMVLIGLLLGTPRLFTGAPGSTFSALRALEAGLYEEVVFRGLLVLGISAIIVAVDPNSQRARLLASWGAVMAGAAGFAWAHEAASSDPTALAMYAGAGVWLGWACLRWGLLPCVIAHAAYDLVVVAT